MFGVKTTRERNCIMTVECPPICRTPSTQYVIYTHFHVSITGLKKKCVGLHLYGASSYANNVLIETSNSTSHSFCLSGQ